MWDWGWKTLNAVFRVISNPPGLVGGFDVRTARGIGTGGRRGIDPPLVVGLQDTFTLVARVREILSVEPAITVRFGGVMFGCHGRGGIRSESCLFGWLLRRRRTK
jgi:hypothetical protein